MNRKPVSLHTVGELICSSRDIGTSKNITVEDYFRQGIAGLSALHTKGYEFNYPGLTERKQIFDNCQKQNNERTRSVLLESLVSVLLRNRWIYEKRAPFQVIRHMSVGLELEIQLVVLDISLKKYSK